LNAISLSKVSDSAKQSPNGEYNSDVDFWNMDAEESLEYFSSRISINLFNFELLQDLRQE